jgi:hypothetical protein
VTRKGSKSRQDSTWPSRDRIWPSHSHHVRLLTRLVMRSGAIHLQTDIVLAAFGFQNPRELSFPRKLELCTSCGIIAPGIVRRLNQLRNVVEHEYRCPSAEEVQDATDIAELFIEATHGLMRLFPHSLRLQSPAGQPTTALYLRLEPRQGELSVCQCGPAPLGDEYSVIPCTNALYPEWISLMVRFTR